MNKRKRPQVKSSIVILLSVILLFVFLPAVKAENLNQPSDLTRETTNVLPEGVEFDIMYSINNKAPTSNPGTVKAGDEVLFMLMLDGILANLYRMLEFIVRFLQ